MSSKKYNFERRHNTIYQITNKINGKSYIGQTIQEIDKYINNHFTRAKRKKSKKYLYRAIRKYGEKNFSWKILWFGKATLEHSNNLELFFVAYYNTFKGNGYNCTEGGDGTRGLSGEKNSCSKTNMSLEKLKAKAKKTVETKRKYGVRNELIERWKGG